LTCPVRADGAVSLIEVLHGLRFFELLRTFRCVQSVDLVLLFTGHLGVRGLFLTHTLHSGSVPGSVGARGLGLIVGVR